MHALVEAARMQIYAKGLNERLWAKALSSSVFTITQTCTSSVKDKSRADLKFCHR